MEINNQNSELLLAQSLPYPRVDFGASLKVLVESGVIAIQTANNLANWIKDPSHFVGEYTPEELGGYRLPENQTPLHTQHKPLQGNEKSNQQIYTFPEREMISSQTTPHGSFQGDNTPDISHVFTISYDDESLKTTDEGYTKYIENAFVKWYSKKYNAPNVTIQDFEDINTEGKPAIDYFFQEFLQEGIKDDLLMPIMGLAMQGMVRSRPAEDLELTYEELKTKVTGFIHGLAKLIEKIGSKEAAEGFKRTKMTFTLESLLQSDDPNNNPPPQN